MKNTTYKLSTLVSAALLIACGGGGGGTASTPTTTTTTTPTPVVVSSNIVTSVPTPTYTPVSEELAAFNLLNAARSGCGFGMLAPNTELDSAAKAGVSEFLCVRRLGC